MNYAGAGVAAAANAAPKISARNLPSLLLAGLRRHCARRRARRRARAPVDEPLKIRGRSRRTRRCGRRVPDIADPGMKGRVGVERGNGHRWTSEAGRTFCPFCQIGAAVVGCSLASLSQWAVLRRLVAGSPSLREETRGRSGHADRHSFNLVRGEDKQDTGRFLIAVQKAMRGPGRNQHCMTGADRHPLAAQERVQRPFLDDDRHFGVRIDASWYPSIRRHGHLFDVERLARVSRAHQDAGLQPRSSSSRFFQILLADDWHRGTSEEPGSRGSSAAAPSAAYLFTMS
jgi:hypothetical protein